MRYWTTANHSLDRGLKQTVDWRLVLCYVALVIIGLVSIYASVHSAEPSSIFDLGCRSGKQFLWICMSLVLSTIVVFLLSPKVWEAIPPFAYILVFLLLVLVIFVSKDTKGSHSWFELGPVKFQPAEVSKITTSLMLAMVMGRQGFRMDRPRDFIMMAAVIALPMLAILGEQETGSALVYAGYIFVLYREGFSGWWLFCAGMVIVLFVLTLTTSWWISIIALTALAALIVIVLMRKRRSHRDKMRILKLSLCAYLAGVGMVFATDVIFENVLQDHQRKRIEVLLGIKEDPSGVGYNVRQSMIAIGSGGMFGKGFLNGTQTTFGFVPELSTDFIFCTIGEEWGFAGCLAVILLYVYMIYRIVEDAEKSRSAFTRIYGYCIASVFFMHLFINIGMTIGIMPVIGIPLPMLSYGGSSLLSFSLMLSIFLALHRQEIKYF